MRQKAGENVILSVQALREGRNVRVIASQSTLSAKFVVALFKSLQLNNGAPRTPAQQTPIKLGEYDECSLALREYHCSGFRLVADPVRNKFAVDRD
jgi:hypothetical protein